MIVVSNTSPINYLILIQAIHLLPELFSKIVIPQEVYGELTDPLTPPLVRDWISNPPNWLDIQSVSLTSDEELALLDPGECAAILLAREIQADLLLIDEMKARVVAKQRGLDVTGIIGILDRAAMMEIVDLPTAINNLRNTSFWASESLLQELLDKYSK